MLDAIGQEIHQVALKPKENIKKELSDIVHKIQNNIDFRTEWDTVKMHFEQMYPHFFRILSKKFNNLSQVDSRHCAYIKLGLSNKEIAQILNISTDSVSKQHNRIKKKMIAQVKLTLREVIRTID